MDPTKLYCCQCTAEGFADVYKLRSHYRDEHADFKVVCNDCFNQFRRQRDLENHEEEEHQKKTEHVIISCVHCAHKVFLYKFGLKNHNGVVHAKHQKLCNECGNMFLDDVDLEKHINKHHKKPVLHHNYNWDGSQNDDEEEQPDED